MRISQRPFPYTCHATRKPTQAFWVVCAGIIFIVFFIVVALDDMPMFATDRPQDTELRKLYYFLFAGFGVVGLARAPSLAGFRDVLPNRVIVARGATRIPARLLSYETLLTALAGGMIAASSVVLVAIFGGIGPLVTSGLQGIVFGPVFFVGSLWLVVSTLWKQVRGISMTPESITYWQGLGRITVAWDELGDAVSTNDVRDHEERRRHLGMYLPGAKIVVPAERVMGVRVPVLWEDYDTPRLLLETDYFTVEPSALLTAILALRDTPELRALLGTRESKVLFTGPPWWVRRHMYRTQQWWPKGAAPEGIALEKTGIVKEFQ